MIDQRGRRLQVLGNEPEGESRHAQCTGIVASQFRCAACKLGDFRRLAKIRCGWRCNSPNWWALSALRAIFTRLPNGIGRRCRHIEVMRVALQRLHDRQRDRPAAATTC